MNTKKVFDSELKHQKGKMLVTGSYLILTFMVITKAVRNKQSQPAIEYETAFDSW